VLLAQGSDDLPPVLPEPVPAPAENLKERPAAKDHSDPTPSAATTPAVPASPVLAEWPGFRGSDRDGIVHNVRIATDWTKSPPVELWRRQIGPGWSSFAVAGDLLYTQEQRGDDEIVASYRVSTGQPVWRHRDAVRFWESNAGAGPRGTPTFSNGRVYAFGGTGLLNALHAATGKVIWSRNVVSDAETEVPMWGFSSSPLVVDDLVVVAASAKLAAYDIATGKPRWFGPAGGFSYSSPHLLTIAGVPQILLLSGTATSVALTSGTLLWQHKTDGGAIVQPAVISEGEVLINTIEAMGGQGIRRLSIAHQSDQWTVDERWSSPGLKPYFNDFVVHKGYAFGFDGSILSCVDLADGKRRWKGGRYGSGQLVLIADQDVLLVLSDTGELALVSATPDAFKEIARYKAIEGKTWNHPVLVRDTLLVRNGEEMAAFRLSLLP
jgi:outer membrane protein assembly factor BamB